jgi:three-Cys-motif partner protein
MGQLIEGDDGLPAEEVGVWAKEKHDYLCRHIDISRGVRRRFIGSRDAGATYIDLFCGPGRCKVRDTAEWLDGGVVAAWKKSLEGDTPFTQIFIGDIDTRRRQAAATRLRQLGAPVMEVDGGAADAVKQVVVNLNPYGLHFAFLDPFDLGALNFDIIVALSRFKRIDMLVHISQMDLQRNAVNYATADDSPFDTFAPGWRERVNINQSQQKLRQDIILYWRDKVAELGVGTSQDVRLITGGKNQSLYWLLLAAKHDLALKFWATASNVEGQGNLAF